MLSVALPDETDGEPSGVGPSKNVIVPAETGPAADVTEEVSVSESPNGEGFALGESVVVVGNEQPGSATSVVNGVSTTPVNAMLSTFQPAAPPKESLPMRNRAWTVLPGAMACVRDVWMVPAEVLTNPGRPLSGFTSPRS